MNFDISIEALKRLKKHTPEELANPTVKFMLFSNYYSEVECEELTRAYDNAKKALEEYQRKIEMNEES